MEKQLLYRTIKKPPKEKRRQHQFSFTDTEFSRLLDQTHRLGFKRPADYVIYISGAPAFEEAISQIYQSQLSVKLMPVKTLINQINRGIDVENNTQQLLREVDGLCQDFR